MESYKPPQTKMRRPDSKIPRTLAAALAVFVLLLTSYAQPCAAQTRAGRRAAAPQLQAPRDNIHRGWHTQRRSTGALAAGAVAPNFGPSHAPVRFEPYPW